MPLSSLKQIIGASAIVLALLLPGIECAPKALKPVVASPAVKMDRWYWRTDQGQSEQMKGLVLFAGRETERYAAILGISEHVPKMLCMWHRESAFDQNLLGDDGLCRGITQVREDYHRRLYRFWKSRGVELGTISDPSTQIAFGVAMFYEHLKAAKGDGWEAVRRYNGSGWKARRYQKRVKITYDIVFGKP